MERRPALSEYAAMWLFTVYDLPVDTREQRREHARFRKDLKREGFMMLQFSVYARYCPSEEGSQVYRKRVRAFLPAHGQVRLISITDRQFAKMEVFFGKSRRPAEDKPAQLMLF